MMLPGYLNPHKNVYLLIMIYNETTAYCMSYMVIKISQYSTTVVQWEMVLWMKETVNVHMMYTIRDGYWYLHTETYRFLYSSDPTLWDRSIQDSITKKMSDHGIISLWEFHWRYRIEYRLRKRTSNKAF